MRHVPRSVMGVLALLLALLLPLEAAHCAWMRLAPHTLTSAPMHACCQRAAARAAAKSAAAGAELSCCPRLPQAVHAAAITVPAPLVAMLAAPRIATSDAPLAVRSPRVASAVHDPPGSAPPAAHGLRAPPILA